MLRIAVQAKGRLFEETMALLEESDIKLSTTKRTLLVQSSIFLLKYYSFVMMIFHKQ